MTRAVARGCARWLPGRGPHQARIWLVTAVLLLAAVFVDAAQKGAEQSAELHFLVIRQASGKPVRNASVVLHPLDKDGRQRNKGFELKTDYAGKASVDGVAYGRLRVQVIAHGLQTYGEDYEVKQPEMEFKIELNEPKHQISIY